MTGRFRGTAVAVFALVLSATAVGTAAADGTDFTLSPTSGPAGTTVTIDASGTTAFPAPTDPAPVTPSVAFNGVAATTVTLVSATELTAVVPATATSGTVTATVGMTTYTGPTFTVTTVPTPQPATWAVAISRQSVTYGASTVVTGTLTDAAGAVGGVTAELQQSTGAGAWLPAAGTQAATTNSAGAVRWTVTPRQNERYRVSSPATSNYLAAVSPPASVEIVPVLTLHPVEVAAAGVTFHLTGTVRPAIAGTLQLQRRNGTTWRPVAQAGAGSGRFSFAVTPTVVGPVRYRVVEAANAEHGAASSPAIRIEVTHALLRYGSSGAEVRALQRRLRELHYDVGPPSSTYGWDMVHAVTAFEKVQGIARDGVAGTQTWRRLDNPKVPHLEHPYPNAPVAVEVNLTKQILMIAKYGKVWRILDTSTAGGYTYTDSAGLTATAITPTGHFTIRYKIDHLVTDTLGTLWRPSYFNYSGDAIHGEGNTNSGSNVPPYAASHGCVRITDLAVDRYYNVLAVGTPVWIYH
ncbi:MAG TPA: peptidoglycan-binding protein [Mycobacteriales bacterium]|nr:peptidoglycan-binding protein [Mycobacteriales bacterium]